MPDKVNAFEDLRVYQSGRQLVKNVYDLTRQGKFRRDFSLTDQIRRAAVSVASNIAEGYERGSNVELIQFLYIAKGSCGEVRAQIGIAHDLEYVSDAEEDQVITQCREVGRMLASFIEYLKKGKFPGQKFKQPPRKSFREEVAEVTQQIEHELEERKKQFNTNSSTSET